MWISHEPSRSQVSWGGKWISNVMTVIGLKEAMKNWLREHGSSEEGEPSSSQRKQGRLSRRWWHLKWILSAFVEDRGFLSWRRDASGSMTIFKSLKGYHVRDWADVFCVTPYGGKTDFRSVEERDCPTFELSSTSTGCHKAESSMSHFQWQPVRGLRSAVGVELVIPETSSNLWIRLF